FAGKRVAVVGGQTVTIGRTSRANFAIPHDTFMSGVHLSVECGPKGCILTDQKSSNGTFVNGARVTQVLLNGGDEIRCGHTDFVVRIVDENSMLPDMSGDRGAKPSRPAEPLPEKETERTVPLDRYQHEKPRSTPGPSPIPVPPGGMTIGGWTLETVPPRWTP